MIKDLKICMLLDFYGVMLSKRQGEIMNFYYNEDLSLGEIALEIGITRQGVRDAIKKAESFLYDTENRLGLVAKMDTVCAAVSKAESALLKISAELPKSYEFEIKNIIDLLNDIKG